MPDSATPEEQVRTLYEQTEAQAAAALDEAAAARTGLGELAAQLAENTLAAVRIGAAAWEELLRTLRLATRRDIARLSRQIARTEAKLERVLREVEALEEELRRPPGEGGAARANARRPKT